IAGFLPDPHEHAGVPAAVGVRQVRPDRPALAEEAELLRGLLEGHGRLDLGVVVVVRREERAPLVAAEGGLPGRDLRDLQAAGFLERPEIQRLRILGTEQRQQRQTSDVLHGPSRTKTRITFPPFHPWRSSDFFAVMSSRTISLGP